MNQIQEDFVPLWKGMELLGVKKSAFFYLVKQKQIMVVPGEGKKDSRYSLKDILQLKDERKRRHFSQESTITLDWMHARDLPAALDLDYQVFDRRIIASYDTYETWLLRNPQIAMCAYERKERRKMLAYVGMIPLPEQVIMDIVTGKRDEMDIKADEIRTYEQTGEYVLLANSAVTHPTRPDLLYPVLSRLMQFWIDAYPQKYISRIYAQAASPSGDILISKLYLAPLYQIEQSQASVVQNAYVLDLSRPGASKVIRHFQKQLEEKQEAQSLPVVEPSPLPTLHIATPEPTTRPRAARQNTTGTPLPDGYVLLNTFRHGISDGGTLTRARGHEFNISEGDWRDNEGHVGKYALSPSEQRHYYEWARTKKNFKACEHCPH